MNLQIGLSRKYSFNAEEEAKKQPRMTNRNNPNAKYEFRERIHSLSKNNGQYNGVHSADNELDAWFYISQIGDEYKGKISEEVEIRRARHSKNYSVK